MERAEPHEARLWRGNSSGSPQTPCCSGDVRALCSHLARGGARPGGPDLSQTARGARSRPPPCTGPAQRRALGRPLLDGALDDHRSPDPDTDAMAGCPARRASSTPRRPVGGRGARTPAVAPRRGDRAHPRGPRDGRAGRGHRLPPHATPPPLDAQRPDPARHEAGACRAALRGLPALRSNCSGRAGRRGPAGPHLTDGPAGVDPSNEAAAQGPAPARLPDRDRRRRRLARGGRSRAPLPHPRSGATRPPDQETGQRRPDPLHRRRVAPARRAHPRPRDRRGLPHGGGALGGDIVRERSLLSADRQAVRCTARELREDAARLAADLRRLGVPPRVVQRGA